MEQINLIDLAKMIKVSAPYLSQIRHDRRKFSSKKAREISQRTGVPIEILLFASGYEIYSALAGSARNARARKKMQAKKMQEQAK